MLVGHKKLLRGLTSRETAQKKMTELKNYLAGWYLVICCCVLVSYLDNLEYSLLVDGQTGEGIFAETLAEDSK